MRSLFLFLSVILLFPLQAEVFFIPGWRVGFAKREGVYRRLLEAFPGEKVTVKAWNSRQPWDVTKKNARDVMQRFFQEISSMPEKEREDLILVGHSIGAKIVVEILSKLADEGKKIHSAVLLGAAVAERDPRIGKLLDAVRFYCFNIYNPGDWVLYFLFPLDDPGSVSLGLYGWHGSDPRFFEAAVTHSDRFAFANHYAYIYLDELGIMLRNVPRFAEIEVIQDEENISRLPADMLYWHNIREYRGWLLQKNVSGKCRILDPDGVRRAQGSEEKMNKSFDDLLSQLKRKSAQP